jgi:curved DNA-binding protein CbpA
MDYFADCKTLEELRAEYRKLCLRYHPDRNHDEDTTRIMQEINAAYTAATKRMTSQDGWSAPHGKQWSQGRETYYADLNEKLRDIIYKLIGIPGVVVEVTGYWLWVEHPDSRAIKDDLKTIGCKWSRNKQQWYYPGIPSRGRGNKSKDDIRAKYGSKRYAGKRKDDKKGLAA